MFVLIRLILTCWLVVRSFIRLAAVGHNEPGTSRPVRPLPTELNGRYPSGFD